MASLIFLFQVWSKSRNRFLTYCWEIVDAPAVIDLVLAFKYNDFKISSFYTDSLSDLPLMELSDITYIVKKNKIVKYDKKGCDKNDWKSDESII